MALIFDVSSWAGIHLAACLSICAYKHYDLAGMSGEPHSSGLRNDQPIICRSTNEPLRIDAEDIFLLIFFSASPLHSVM